MMVFGSSGISRRLFHSLISVAFFLTHSGSLCAQEASSESKLSLSEEIRFTQGFGIRNVVIPQSLGFLKKSHQGTGHKFIIHIQDLHTHPEAQKKIGQTVNYLRKQYGVRLVGVEGAEGVINMEGYRELRHRKAVQQSAEYLLQQGILTGSEYLAMTSHEPFRLVGLEDLSLHTKNLNEFRKTIRSGAPVLQALEKRESQLKELKKRHYSPELLELDGTLERDRLWDLSSYFETLQQHAKALAIPIETKKGIASFLKTRDLEAKLELGEVKKEQALLLERLSPKLSQVQLQALVKMALEMKLGRVSLLEYFESLEDLVKKTDGTKALGNVPHFELYLEYLRSLSQVGDQDLFQEAKTLEDLIKARLFKTDMERKLDRLSKNLSILRKFLSLTLSSQELEYFQKHRDDVEVGTREVVKNAENFYRTAKARDRVIVQNLIRHMDEERAETAILVTGGFHTEGMMREFQKKGIPYVVVTPNIASSPEEGRYLSLMMQETLPLQKFMEILYRPNVWGSKISRPLFAADPRNDALFRFLYAAFQRGEVPVLTLPGFSILKKEGPVGKGRVRVEFWMKMGDQEVPVVSVMKRQETGDDRNFLTLDDVQIKQGDRVLVRVDLNAPVKDGRIVLTERIKAATQTISELSQKGAKVIILAHQGRPGDPDYMESLEQHAALLSTQLGQPVQYIDDLYGHTAQIAIQTPGTSERGEVLLLKNVRSGEGDPAFVATLEPLINLFVLDGFSVAHRDQPSVTGFKKIPNIAGRLMQQELENANRFLQSVEHPYVELLGGAKISDHLDALEYGLENGLIDHVLTGGMLAQLLLIIKGNNLGEFTLQALRSQDVDAKKRPEGLLSLLPRIRHIYEKYPEKFDLPVDVAYVGEEGRRQEIAVAELGKEGKYAAGLPYLIGDNGARTARRYASMIASAKTVFVKGPQGNYKVPQFRTSSELVLQALKDSGAFWMTGGGDTDELVGQLGLSPSHRSLAGGAFLEFKAGKTLPGVQRLIESKENTGHQKRGAGGGTAIQVNGEPLTPDQDAVVDEAIRTFFDPDVAFKYGFTNTRPPRDYRLSRSHPDYNVLDPKSILKRNGVYLYVLKGLKGRIATIASERGVDPPVHLLTHPSTHFGKKLYLDLDHVEILKNLPEELRLEWARHEVMHLEHPHWSEDTVQVLAPIDHLVQFFHQSLVTGEEESGEVQFDASLLEALRRGIEAVDSEIAMKIYQEAVRYAVTQALKPFDVELVVYEGVSLNEGFSREAFHQGGKVQYRLSQTTLTLLAESVRDEKLTSEGRRLLDVYIEHMQSWAKGADMAVHDDILTLFDEANRRDRENGAQLLITRDAREKFGLQGFLYRLAQGPNEARQIEVNESVLEKARQAGFYRHEIVWLGVLHEVRHDAIAEIQKRHPIIRELRGKLMNAFPSPEVLLNGLKAFYLVFPTPELYEEIQASKASDAELKNLEQFYLGKGLPPEGEALRRIQQTLDKMLDTEERLDLAVEELLVRTIESQNEELRRHPLLKNRFYKTPFFERSGIAIQDYFEILVERNIPTPVDGKFGGQPIGLSLLKFSNGFSFRTVPLLEQLREAHRQGFNLQGVDPQKVKRTRSVGHPLISLREGRVRVNGNNDLVSDAVSAEGIASAAREFLTIVGPSIRAGNTSVTLVDGGIPQVTTLTQGFQVGTAARQERALTWGFVDQLMKELGMKQMLFDYDLVLKDQKLLDLLNGLSLALDVVKKDLFLTVGNAEEDPKLKAMQEWQALLRSRLAAQGKDSREINVKAMTMDQFQNDFLDARTQNMIKFDLLNGVKYVILTEKGEDLQQSREALARSNFEMSWLEQGQVIVMPAIDVARGEATLDVDFVIRELMTQLGLDETTFKAYVNDPKDENERTHFVLAVGEGVSLMGVKEKVRYFKVRRGVRLSETLTLMNGLLTAPLSFVILEMRDYLLRNGFTEEDFDELLAMDGDVLLPPVKTGSLVNQLIKDKKASELINWAA